MGIMHTVYQVVVVVSRGDVPVLRSELQVPGRDLPAAMAAGRHHGLVQLQAVADAEPDWTGLAVDVATEELQPAGQPEASSKTAL